MGHSVGPRPFLTDLSSDKTPALTLKTAHWEHPCSPAHNMCSSCTVRIW